MITPFKFHNFNFSFMRHNFGAQITSLLKQWIDANYKLIKAKSKLYFLKSCKYNRLTPPHLSNNYERDFHLFHYKAKKKLERILTNFKLNILNIEIFDLHRQIHLFHRTELRTAFVLSNELPTQIWNAIHKHHTTSFHNFHRRTSERHYKKFIWLLNNKNIKQINEITPINYSVTTNNEGNQFSNNSFINDNYNINIEPKIPMLSAIGPLDYTNDKWFLNLSSVSIPESVSNILQLGGNFCLPTNQRNKNSIHELIKDIEVNILKRNCDASRMRNTAITYINRSLNNKMPLNSTDLKLDSLYKNALNFCRLNPDVIFTRADKGNVTVSLDKNTYLTQMKELLNDTNTYTIVKKNPVTSIEKCLNKTLKRWVDNEFIPKKDFFRLRASDTLLPRAYGLPKIHKQQFPPPFRIIVSSINTALYFLASYLQDIIMTSIPEPKSHINNSFDLYKVLNGKHIEENEVLFSLDVASLFTNIPIELAIRGVLNRWNFIALNTRIPKEEFVGALEFVLTSTFFMFDGTIYKQLFGTPMGSPLSPIIADIVMQDLEDSPMGSIDLNISTYYRYVDDIFLVAPESNIERILETFNKLHDRIKFTCEKETNRSLSFLDLLIQVKNNSIIVDWYQKETFSGRTLSFFSNHPLCQKIGVIYNLIDRALLLSHPIYHKKNLEKCIQILTDNGYPLDIIFIEINRRIKKLINNKTQNNSEMDGNPDKRISRLVFPYIQHTTDAITRKLRHNHSIGYRCINKLNNVVKVHKDNIQRTENNNVVYRLACNNCDAAYVGQSKRQLRTRIKEHRANIKSNPDKHSVVSEHIIQCNHSFDWEHVTILDREANYHKRLISEMIHIKEQKNSINLMKDTELLDKAYSNILEKLS
jgi:hypothetical protein